MLAEGIDSEEQLAGARAYGATLGQGYLLGAPGPLPEPLPEPGRGLKLPGGGGDPFGAAPWERVTNWRRPGKGSRRMAAEAARVIVDHAAELGPTAMVLASLADESHGPDSVARYGWLPKRVAFVGVLNAGDAFDGTGVRGGTLAARRRAARDRNARRARARLRRLLRGARDRPGRVVVRGHL